MGVVLSEDYWGLFLQLCSIPGKALSSSRTCICYFNWFAWKFLITWEVQIGILSYQVKYSSFWSSGICISCCKISSLILRRGCLFVENDGLFSRILWSSQGSLLQYGELLISKALKWSCRHVLWGSLRMELLSIKKCLLYQGGYSSYLFTKSS